MTSMVILCGRVSYLPVVRGGDAVLNREWFQGPRELSIRRRSAVEIIHGPRSKCKKSTWYDQVSTSDAKSSIHMTRDTALHRSRRKVWDRAFTPKGEYTPTYTFLYSPVPFPYQSPVVVPHITNLQQSDPF